MMSFRLGGGEWVWLDSLALGKARYALGESVLLDQLGAAYPVFGLGRKGCVAATVEVQGDDLRQSIAPHVESFAVLQALKESELLLVHLEQLGVPLTVEGGILQEQKGRAGVHDAVGIGAEVVGGLTNHGHAPEVLADGL